MDVCWTIEDRLPMREEAAGEGSDHVRPAGPAALSASDGLESLVAAARDGAPGAAESLWSAQAPVLTRAAIALGVPIEEAKDVVQESLVYAFRNLGRFDAGRAPFRVWIHQILVGRCRNWHRARRRFLTAVGRLMRDGNPPVPDRPDEILERKQERERLANLVAGLSPQRRRVWALVQAAGLPIREAAAVLRMKEATARSHLRHAREAILDAARRECL